MLLKGEHNGDRLTGRFGLWMANIERSIAGKFYFGEKPSYADFHLAMILNMMQKKALNALIAKTGDCFAKYPKAAGIVTAIYSLPSGEKVPYKDCLPPQYFLADEKVAEY